MTGDIERVLAALNRADVRYLVVGGVAVVLHGHLRTTADLDLVVELESRNVGRALGALEELGFRPRAPVPMKSFADRRAREQWIQEKGLVVFSLWNPRSPGFEVDLFAREPFDFEAAYSRSARVALDAVEATVISLADLIATKEAAGRPRDREDVEALRAIQNELGERPGGEDTADG